MDVAMHYMNHSDHDARWRFIVHLQSKYFPDGAFVAKLEGPTTLRPRGWEKKEIENAKRPMGMPNMPAPPPLAMPEKNK